MADLEEVLRRAMTGASNRYHEANSDLQNIVAEASLSVEKVSGGRAKLLLLRTGDNSEGTFFTLRLETMKPGRKGPWTDDIETLLVPNDGYPIRFGTRQSWTPLADPGALQAHFGDLLGKEDSPVVIHLLVLMRTERP